MRVRRAGVPRDAQLNFEISFSVFSPRFFPLVLYLY